MMVDAGHDVGLVILSLMIAVWGIYTSLSVLCRTVFQNGGQRLRSLLAAGILMGGAIWAMHYMALLSLDMPVAAGYDPLLIISTLFIAIILSLVSLALLNWSYHLAGISLGFTVFIVFYACMYALNVEAEWQFDLLLTGVSLLLAIVISATALRLAEAGFSRGKGESVTLFHFQAALLLGLGLSIVHFISSGGLEVIPALTTSSNLETIFYFSHSDLALVVLSVLVAATIFVPLLMMNIEFRSSTLAQCSTYWLVGVGILGVAMTVLGQWYSANLFQKEEALVHAGYRIQNNLIHLQNDHQVVKLGHQMYDFDEWSGYVESTNRVIDEALFLDSMVSIRRDEHLRGELQAIFRLLGESLPMIKQAVEVADQGGDVSRFLGEIDHKLLSLKVVSEDLLTDSSELRDYNRDLIGVINGANIIWFILVFGSIVSVMRRRQDQLASINGDLNQTLRELQRHKYAMDQHAIVALTDETGCITYVNDEFCRISQYGREELIGKNHRVINSGYHSREFWQEMWRTIGAGQVWQGEIKNRKKDGEYYWVYTTIVPFLDSNNRLERYLSIRTDISEIKRAELELRENEYWMNSLIQALPDEILLQDSQDRWLIANDILLRNLGIARDEYQGQTSKQLAEKSDILKQRLLIDGDEEHIWKRDDLVHWELEYPTVNGSAVFDTVNVPLFEDDASRKGVVRVMRDITVRKRMAEENQMLASAVFQANEGMFITGADGMLEYVNPAYEEMLCHQEGTCIGHPVQLLDKDVVGDEFAEPIWSALVRGDSWSGRYTREGSDKLPESNLMVSISPVYTAKGMRYVGVLRDITDETHLESRLHQAQKMEAIGRLAGGIAHDFNNILTAIIGYADLIIDDLPEGSDAYYNMQEIQLASQRAKDLVKQILTFSRRTDNKLHAFEAEGVLKEAVRLMRATIPASISIKENFNGAPMILRMDATQLHQIIMNLCVNSAQAMDEHGEMVIETRRLPVAQTPIVIGEDGPVAEEYIELSVSDNGPGIPEKLLERIFEPFFTTKEVGSGTGMGLAAVHGIVSSSRGEIFVSNRATGGARFDIYLPLVSSESEPSKVIKRVVKPSPAQEYIGAILYVDDEVPLTNVIQKFLERKGYHVDISNDPLEALEIFKKNPDKYDVVISDQVMPDMRGDQLGEQIIAIRADIPFVICSGYSDTINLNSAREKGMHDFLQKPIDFMKLDEYLRELIQSKK